jgi:[acyl-carrier-protein] S-malonyltransferase
MGKDLWENFPLARETFEEASEALNEDVAKLCFEGPEERLRLTANTQPAILAVSVAVWRVLKAETGVIPHCAAGHSLGEYGALVAAGVLPFSEAVRAVRQRGRFMQEAVPEGRGTMAAVMGLDAADVEAACRDYTGPGVVTPANYNGPGQVVISGDVEAVEAVSRVVKERGARKVAFLPVSAPFHCPLMKPAGKRLKPVLERIPLGEFSFEVMSNVEARPYPSSDSVVDLLTRQVSSPVLWQSCVEMMVGKGVDLAIEVGPKKVLLGLWRRIAPKVEVLQMEDRQGLNALLERLD